MSIVYDKNGKMLGLSTRMGFRIVTRTYGTEIGFVTEINAKRAVAKWLRSNFRGYMATDLFALKL